MMSLKFLVAFATCFASYAFHSVIHLLERKGHDFAESKVSHVIVPIVTFVGYFAWGLMMSWDPVRMGPSSYVALPLGLIMGLTGLVMLVAAVIAKRGFGEVDHLVTTGIYSRIRHPLYLGLILVHVGFPLVARSVLTLISAAIWIPLIELWRHWEQQALEKRFGIEYAEYKRRTLL
jgi:protein-S-isoprenylcysteine O-methyltransferase Ste14